jgi:DNA-binding CsgD family transcriptional regulator
MHAEIYATVSSNSKCNTVAPMGYGVARHTRSYRHLSDTERETLSLGLAQGQSLRAMATVLGRAPSTVSRELARNRTRDPPQTTCDEANPLRGNAC